MESRLALVSARPYAHGHDDQPVREATPVDGLGQERRLEQAPEGPSEPATSSTVGSLREQLPPVFTIDELAAYLRVNHKTVREAIARGEIPGVCRLGNTIRIHTSTVLAWLAAGQSRVSRKRYR
jgi:excisionase family DNA binding protein